MKGSEVINTQDFLAQVKDELGKQLKRREQAVADLAAFGEVRYPRKPSPGATDNDWYYAYGRDGEADAITQLAMMGVRYLAAACLDVLWDNSKTADDVELEVMDETDNVGLFMRWRHPVAV